MANKTKAELLAELELKKKEIEELKGDIDKAKSEEKFDDCAKGLWNMRCSLMNA